MRGEIIELRGNDPIESELVGISVGRSAKRGYSLKIQVKRMFLGIVIYGK